MNQSLAEIFKKKQKQPIADRAIDWDDRKHQYLQAVDGLYAQIGKLLGVPIKQKTVSLQRRPKDLSENYIGTYKIDDLVLLTGDEQVRFSPRGRNIAGAIGRVDVVGERGEEVLIVQPGPRWCFVQTRQPTLKVVPFDGKSLGEVLKRVMRE